jgi:hypothetical protein
MVERRRHTQQAMRQSGGWDSLPSRAQVGVLFVDSCHSRSLADRELSAGAFDMIVAL